MEGIEIIEAKGKQIQLKVTSANIQKVLVHLSKLPIEDMAFPEATLEDTFMEFYGEGRQ
jgi:hypothetical protein